MNADTLTAAVVEARADVERAVARVLEAAAAWHEARLAWREAKGLNLVRVYVTPDVLEAAAAQHDAMQAVLDAAIADAERAGECYAAAGRALAEAAGEVAA